MNRLLRHRFETVTVEIFVTPKAASPPPFSAIHLEKIAREGAAGPDPGPGSRPERNGLTVRGEDSNR
jgi:hypothetical protein